MVMPSLAIKFKYGVPVHMAANPVFAGLAGSAVMLGATAWWISAIVVLMVVICFLVWSISSRNGLDRTQGELPRKEHFTKHLESTFRISNESSPKTFDLQLIEVREELTTEGFEQFSVLFTGPEEPLLEQGRHRFKHSFMGLFELFIVPISSDKSGTCYEAVFSRKQR